MAVIPVATKEYDCKRCGECVVKGTFLEESHAEDVQLCPTCCYHVRTAAVCATCGKISGCTYLDSKGLWHHYNCKYPPITEEEMKRLESQVEELRTKRQKKYAIKRLVGTIRSLFNF